MNNAKTILKIYQMMFDALGPQQWWPGETPFEVVIGAILTQNTNWSNGEKAIKNLKTAGRLSPGGIQELDLTELAQLIRPSGFFNVKARRVKTFINWLFSRYEGNLSSMFAQDLQMLRDELLSVKGIGPETADSILLYAGNLPTFVVDAYTHRIFSRHGFIGVLHQVFCQRAVVTHFVEEVYERTRVPVIEKRKGLLVSFLEGDHELAV